MPYVLGQHKFVCDQCGFTFLSAEKRRRWDGLIVDPACDDKRPDWFSPPRVWPEGLPVRDARPPPGNDGLPLGTFIAPGAVTRDDL